LLSGRKEKTSNHSRKKKKKVCAVARKSCFGTNAKKSRGPFRQTVIKKDRLEKKKNLSVSGEKKQSLRLFIEEGKAAACQERKRQRVLKKKRTANPAKEEKRFSITYGQLKERGPKSATVDEETRDVTNIKNHLVAKKEKKGHDCIAYCWKVGRNKKNR